MTFNEYVKNAKKGNGAIITIAPSWDILPKQVKEKYKSCGAAFFAFYKVLLDSVNADSTAVLFDVPSFEAYGIEGYVLLKALSDYSQNLGMVTIADASRAVKNAAEISKLAKAWLSDNDLSFKCDALSFATDGLSDELLEKIGSEVARNNGGAFVTDISVIEKISDENCGVILRGSCREILKALEGRNSILSLAVPTAFESEEELRDVSEKATLIAAPDSVVTPGAFYNFKELLD